jgi:hypothetical protein
MQMGEDFIFGQAKSIGQLFNCPLVLAHHLHDLLAHYKPWPGVM